MRKSKIPADQKRSAITATVLRPAEREQLVKYAAARGLSVSTILRKLILRDLRKNKVVAGIEQQKAG